MLKTVHRALLRPAFAADAPNRQYRRVHAMSSSFQVHGPAARSIKRANSTECDATELTRCLIKHQKSIGCTLMLSVLDQSRTKSLDHTQYRQMSNLLRRPCPMLL